MLTYQDICDFLIACGYTIQSRREDLPNVVAICKNGHTSQKKIEYFRRHPKCRYCPKYSQNDFALSKTTSDEFPREQEFLNGREFLGKQQVPNNDSLIRELQATNEKFKYLLNENLKLKNEIQRLNIQVACLLAEKDTSGATDTEDDDVPHSMSENEEEETFSNSDFDDEVFSVPQI